MCPCERKHHPAARGLWMLTAVRQLPLWLLPSRPWIPASHKPLFLRIIDSSNSLVFFFFFFPLCLLLIQFFPLTYEEVAKRDTHTGSELSCAMIQYVPHFLPPHIRWLWKYLGDSNARPLISRQSVVVPQHTHGFPVRRIIIFILFVVVTGIRSSNKS